MSSVVQLVEPAYHSSPPRDFTDGEDVADLCEVAGFTPDPEQRLGLDDIFAVRDGKSAAFETAVIGSRQNFKTGLLKMAALGWLYITEQRLIVWSAHEFRTAQEAFRDMTELIEGCPYLDQQVKQIHRGNGDEAIELLNGCRVIFKARTKAGGRGLSGDKIILDEAFALQPTHMGALLPTLSARPDPQVVYASSAGLAQSDVLRAIRDRGRAGDDPSLAYLEWCDDLPGECADPLCTHALGSEGCRLDDPARWARANTALGRRITVDYIAAERRALPPAEFARERLGWWDEPEHGQVLIPGDLWAACEDRGSQITGSPWFGLDVSPDRSTAAIAAAGDTARGLSHVEITSYDAVLDCRPGVGWVVPRLVDMRSRFPDLRVAIASDSAAVSLQTELERAGIGVDLVSSADLKAACGLFFDKAIAGQLRHLGQPDLSGALTAARKHQEDGETAWRWGRRRSTGDITALYAATLALWAATKGDQQVTTHFINLNDDWE